MPENDENTKKLINVAVTRARRRLMVVGDFSYIEGLSKRAFLGRDFIPYVKDKFPIQSALDIAPLGILTRAAEASKLISRGEIESDSARIIVTQDDFYPLLLEDIDSAEYRVVIYSPFMTQNRLGELQPIFRSAKEKGVNVFVITKPLQERNKRSQEHFRYLEQTLEDWGVTIIHKRGMHEKLVIIDDKILWSGSLNPLSYSDTQEIMERRVSDKIIEEYSKIIRLDELIKEFDEERPTCPICESEVVASEGRNDPYFWRCVVDGCYSRSIDQPKIHGGIIVCASCGGEVEFGRWGSKPAWRCVDNKRHHQKIVRNHLKLPKMRKKIPLEQIDELEKM
jgi:predicted nucleic acid-binding protein